MGKRFYRKLRTTGETFLVNARGKELNTLKYRCMLRISSNKGYIKHIYVLYIYNDFHVGRFLTVTVYYYL